MKTGTKWASVAVAVVLVASGCSGSGADEVDAVAPPTTATTTSLVPETTTVAPTTTTTTTTIAPTTTEYQLSDSTIERLFVELVRDESYRYEVLTWIDVMYDDEIVEWGYTFCDIMDSTQDAEDTFDIVVFAGEQYHGDEWYIEDEWLVYYAGGAAVTAFCDEYIPLIGELA